MALQSNWPDECIDLLVQNGATLYYGFTDTPTITPDIIKEILSRNCIFHDCRNGCVKWDLRILERPRDSQIVGCSEFQPIGGTTYSCRTCNADVCTICRQFCHGDHEVNIVFEYTSYLHEKKCACKESACKSPEGMEVQRVKSHKPLGKYTPKANLTKKGRLRED